MYTLHISCPCTVLLQVGDRVSAYTTKMEETDTWFEEKTVMVENLDK